MQHQQRLSLRSHLSNAFKAIIGLNPQIASSVQGFTEYGFLGFACRTPHQVQNILGPRFDRTFDILVKKELESIKTDPSIVKQQLYLDLLQKYCGITIDLEVGLTKANVCNADHSIPSEDDVEATLHHYYLQPSKLFGILPNQRKHICLSSEARDLEWRWGSGADTDMAKIFRKIICLYILDDIIDDLNDPTKKEYHHESLLSSKDDLVKLYEKECEKFIRSLSSCFLAIKKEHSENLQTDKPIQGSPSGFLSNYREDRLLDNFMPGLFDVVGLYPAGRLLFGQPDNDLHYELALGNADVSRRKVWDTFKRWGRFVFAHLNLSTSLMWLKCSLFLMLSQWRQFRAHVVNPNAPVLDILKSSLMLIPNMLVIVASPILIAFPWVYGITSLPFSLLRLAVIHGPINFTRNYMTLMLLDGIEVTKDIFLLFSIGLPLLESFFMIANGILPNTLLTIGMGYAYTPIYITCIALALCILFKRDTHYRDGENIINLLDPRTALTVAASATARMLGLLLFLSSTVYVSSALLLQRFLSHHTEERLRYFRAYYTIIENWASAIQRFIPVLNRQQNQESEQINIPNVKKNMPLTTAIAIDISPEMRNTADQLKRQIGILNMALHLSTERKQNYKNLYQRLDDPKLPKIELAQAIEEAHSSLNDNMTAEEVDSLEKLHAHLKSKGVTGLNHERIGFMQFKQNNTYQPSWALVQAIKQSGHFAALSPQTRQKCEHIESLRNRVTLPS